MPFKVNEYSGGGGGGVAPGIPVVNESGCVKCGGGLSLPIQPRSGNASSEALDLSLCGDPLMYATFVAPVQQYSTESTEPSRQPSFNYASRQPSFKQNSSETEPHALGPGGGGGGAPGDHFFPGGLPPPSPDHHLLHHGEEDVQEQCCQMCSLLRKPHH